MCQYYSKVNNWTRVLVFLFVMINILSNSYHFSFPLLLIKYLNSTPHSKPHTHLYTHANNQNNYARYTSLISYPTAETTSRTAQYNTVPMFSFLFLPSIHNISPVLEHLPTIIQPFCMIVCRPCFIFFNMR